MVVITPHPEVKAEPIPATKQLDISDILLSKLTSQSRYESQTPHNIEAFEKTSPPLDYVKQCDIHALVETWHTAYSLHLPLSISPDHIKLVILQGLSIHINQNAESLRHHFVNHSGKKEIKVFRDDFGPPGSPNPWKETFSLFTEKVGDDIKDPELYKLIHTPCTTTTATDQAVNDIAMLDAFQKYYDYVLVTCCGFPKIQILGTPDDWKHIKALVEHISKYELQWWTDKILPICDQFIAAASGNADLEFWKGIVKKNNAMSGTPSYSGWVRLLFPYITDYTGKYSKNTWSETIDSTAFTSGISSTPFIWDYLGKQYNMKFFGGFLGMTKTADGYITPGVSWLVAREKHPEPIRQIPVITFGETEQVTRLAF